MHWISNRLVSQTGLHTRSLIEKGLKIPHNSSQAEPSQAKPSQAKPSQAKLSQAECLEKVWKRFGQDIWEEKGLIGKRSEE